MVILTLTEKIVLHSHLYYSGKILSTNSSDIKSASIDWKKVNKSKYQQFCFDIKQNNASVCTLCLPCLQNDYNRNNTLKLNSNVTGDNK